MGHMINISIDHCHCQLQEQLDHMQISLNKEQDTTISCYNPPIKICKCISRHQHITHINIQYRVHNIVHTQKQTSNVQKRITVKIDSKSGKPKWARELSKPFEFKFQRFDAKLVKFVQLYAVFIQTNTTVSRFILQDLIMLSLSF